ncbi:FMN-binding negative transcriptional regulator [Mesonia sp. HuA40]|uniref:FMN-binding negative transcriptional regulator n=1 Tax=Mesonia sp. HuA40 TaxID=2602761 RepID=UPI0011CC050C|nr:FMN-binding negative transcriptional regulator [Mesonia sp. HuA40]TXK73778.1 FMN-binding negative transcriptional regulator [Mesonia sp. HuA40]
MYYPKAYQKKDKSYIFDFIKAYPFCSMVIQGEELLATHIPIMLDGNADAFKLIGHIAKSNPQFEYLKSGTEALFIFQGPQAYVSSSWYPHKDISTWDYSAVHVNAKLFPRSQRQLEKDLKILVNHFESRQENPLYYEDLPRNLIEKHLPLILGFQAIPYKIQAIAKYHQKQSQETQIEVCKHLSKEKSTKEVAKAISNENHLK